MYVCVCVFFFFLLFPFTFALLCFATWVVWFALHVLCFKKVWIVLRSIKSNWISLLTLTPTPGGSRVGGKNGHPGGWTIFFCLFSVMLCFVFFVLRFTFIALIGNVTETRGARVRRTETWMTFSGVFFLLHMSPLSALSNSTRWNNSTHATKWQRAQEMQC